MTSRATLAKQPGEVARMFDGVARRYDLTNSVLSFGLDRYWRSQTRLLLGAEAGETILDLAAGTGVSTEQLSGSGAHAIACDFSLGMLRAGRRRRPRVTFVAGDATRLPFADDSIDGATISFGLRNVVDVPGALRELARVVKPDGRLVICEFSRPTFAPFRHVYVEYLMRALPRIAARVSSNADAYVYLAESIRAWPAQRELTELIRANGWDHVAYRNLTGGIVALHVASQPEAASASRTAQPPEA